MSDLAFSPDTMRWLEAAGFEVRSAPGRLEYGNDWSNYYPFQIIEQRPNGEIAWLEAEERTMAVSWKRGFASLELAEKRAVADVPMGVRRAWRDLSAKPAVVISHWFTSADPRCVFVPATHSECGDVVPVWCEDRLLAWFPRLPPGFHGEASRASHVLPESISDLKRSFLSPDGSPLFSTERPPMPDLDTIDWPGKNGDFTSPRSPMCGTMSPYKEGTHT